MWKTCVTVEDVSMGFLDQALPAELEPPLWANKRKSKLFSFLNQIELNYYSEYNIGGVLVQFRGYSNFSLSDFQTCILLLTINLLR